MKDTKTITTKNEEGKLVSKCCNADLITVCGRDDVTCHYECKECSMPCDAHFNPTPTDTQEPNCYDKKGNRIPFCYDDKLKKAAKDCAEVLESESTDTQTEVISKIKFENMSCKDTNVDLNCKIAILANKINEVIEVLNEK
jgi:hypothetical protein